MRCALLPAAFDVLTTVTHFYYAVSMANVAYMVALKRTSLLIGTVCGFLLFRERLIGALLMFAGFIIVVIAR